jgi:hypothetical protein
MIHLGLKERTDYTSLEQYFVDKLAAKKEAELFPLSQAISLDDSQDKSLEQRVDQLAASVHEVRDLLRAQLEREAERERREADRAWREASTRGGTAAAATSSLA